MAGKKNIIIEQGTTFRLRVTYQTGTPTRVKAVNLTGYTARLQIRPHANDPILLLELTTESGGITITPTQGILDLYMGALATSSINWTSAVYDLKLIAPNGEVKRLIEGRVTVSPEVTI